MSFSSSSQKYITIATDISADNTYDVWTWAIYIRWGGGVIKRVGQFKQSPKSTLEAETMALCNALVIAYSQVPYFEMSRVVIHNEIEVVLTPNTSEKKSRYGRKTKKEADANRTKAISDIAIPLLERAQSWELRKIKAHYKHWKTSDNPAKYAINRWCDYESRRLMKALRKPIKKTDKAAKTQS